MGVSTGPKLDYLGATETGITVSFTPQPSVSSFDICWKEYPQKWENEGESEFISVINSTENKTNNKIKHTSEGLNPGTTYTFRVICRNEDGDKGKPGPELIIDTDTVSCTPHHKCSIL